MNRKSFGKLSAVLLFTAALGFVSACAEKIPGNPEITMKEYIEAVQKRDFKTIYYINRSTARQSKYILKSKDADTLRMDAENLEKNRLEFEAIAPNFTQGVRWNEKHFFPSSSIVKIGKPQDFIKQIDKQRPGENYEKGNTVQFLISVDYPNATDAPEISGIKLKYAEYICSLGKIRQDQMVMIYSIDDKWYFNSCMVDMGKVQYQ